MGNDKTRLDKTTQVLVESAHEQKEPVELMTKKMKKKKQKA